MAPDCAIELNQLWLGWREHTALRDVSGQFARASLTAVVGPNGAGKSTLMKALAGELAPVRGQVRVAPNLTVASLPQLAGLDLSVPISVFDLVALGAWQDLGPWRGLSRSAEQACAHALHTVGLGELAQRPLATLSGGQLARALFARLMLRQADVVLLDEPFAAVDQATTQDLLLLLQDWQAQGRTIIVVLHDMELVRQHFPSTLLLAGQLVAWGPTAEVLTGANLHQAQHLCAGMSR